MAQHKVLAFMAAEAQAKLSIAKEAVQGVFGQGDPHLFAEAINGGGLIKEMTEHFLKNGPDSINDPDVLMSGFNMFFKNEELVSAYSDHYLKELKEWKAGEKPITESMFTESYGFAIGSDVNFMAEKNIDAKYLERMIEETNPDAFIKYSKIGQSDAQTSPDIKDKPDIKHTLSSP